MSRDGRELTHLGLHGLGGIASPIAIDIDDPSRLYAGTRAAGVWSSMDAGATWSPASKGMTFQEVWSLAQHPTTGELYAGVGPAAVYRSGDRSGAWEISRQLMALPGRHLWEFPGPPYFSHVKGLGLSAADPRLVFGAVEEGGLIRSRDGGITWESIQNGVEFDCHSVNVMPDDPDVVVATTGTGAYRSVDGGDSFSVSNDGIDRRYLTALAPVHPDAPQVLFVGGAQAAPPSWQRPDGASASLFRSLDQGRHWTRLVVGDADRWRAWPAGLAVDPLDPYSLYVGMADGRVWFSDDAGDSCVLCDRCPAPIMGIRVALS